MPLITSTTVWDYQATTNAVPSVPASVTIPSTGYSQGLAPFGVLGSVPLPKAIATTWAVDTAIWVRKALTLSGNAPIILIGKVENAAFIYFDGVLVASINPTNTDRGTLTDFQIVISKSMASSGTHTLAVLLLDDIEVGAGDCTYFYLEADYTAPMISLQPSSPAKETLEWKTDVIESKNGTENRLQTRISPRQSFEFTYPAGPQDTQSVFHAIYSQRGYSWLIPIWTQAQRLGAIASGQSSLTANTSFEFRDGTLALLWQSASVWQIISLDKVGSGTLDLITATDAFSDAWLMPLRKGRLLNNPQKKLNGYNAEWALVFGVDDNYPLTVSAPTQYLSDDIYYDVPLLAGESTTDDIITRIDKFDEDLGVVKTSAPWLYSRVGRTHRIVAADATEAWTIRQWFHRRCGKFRRFWQPTFENDLRLMSTGTITNTIIVRNDDYLRFATSRAHIAILAGGNWYPRSIISATALDGVRTQLTLNSALNVAASTVSMVCYLGLKRLDTDRVEINWINGGVAQTETRILELSP